MPARDTHPVRYLTDETADPPKRQEVVTRSPNALAFWLGGTYARPDHRFDSCLTGNWAVIEHHALTAVEPLFIRYDRAEAPLPFEVVGQRFAQLGEAMEVAAAAIREGARDAEEAGR